MGSKSIIILVISVAMLLCTGLRAREVTEDKEQANLQSNYPEGPGTCIPEPIPQPENFIEQSIESEENKIICYNDLTGEESILEFENENIHPEKHSRVPVVEEPGLPEDLINLFNFSELEIVPDPDEFPWRVNCKLYYTKNGTRYQSSGILIDPKHVLTAGYCVHEGSGGSWVTDLEVIPAYVDGIEPFGRASSINKVSWNGWINDGDYKYNIGIIELDRPIGAITNYLDYGSIDDPGVFSGAPFQNVSYPVDAPFDGEYMYYQHGTFDFTTPDYLGFYRKPHGGMGGSGLYVFYENDDRIVYGVLSHENNNATYCTSINSTEKQQIENYINSNTPSRVDFMPLHVRTSSTIRAGDRLPYLTFLVHNYSSASWSGVLNIMVYISRNDSISPADILLDSNHITGSFGPKETQLWNYAPVTPLIQSGIAPGDYYIGLAIGYTDYNPDNNYSNGDDAAPITIY